MFSVEHSFSILHGYMKAKECAEYRGDTNIIGVYFQLQFPQVKKFHVEYFVGILKLGEYFENKFTRSIALDIRVHDSVQFLERDISGHH